MRVRKVFIYKCGNGESFIYGGRSSHLRYNLRSWTNFTLLASALVVLGTSLGDWKSQLHYITLHYRERGGKKVAFTIHDYIAVFALRFYEFSGKKEKKNYFYDSYVVYFGPIGFIFFSVTIIAYNHQLHY